MRVFIDSNIPMYVAGKAHPNKGPAERFLKRVGDGDVDACTSTEVLQEILWRYAAIKRLDLAEKVYDLFVHICPQVLPITLADTDRAKQILVTVTGLSARDAVHAAVMLNHDVHTIASFDTGFDAVSELTRMTLA